MFPRSTFLVLLAASPLMAAPVEISGINPAIASFNNEGECGTGAVVPWADRVWWLTYAPHSPSGSSDKLYSLGKDGSFTVHPESIGGTPANRLVHLESNQLFMGPYAIDAGGKVRAVPYKKMLGRPTGTARHLTDPANKVVTATMEEGIYEVDVKTLETRELWADTATERSPRKANLPGYHGKGFYSGQGVYVYANNGEYGSDAKSKPETPSGVLAEWDGQADKWTVVRRNQFTEVTGPGGITGNPHPATDPIWTIGWDYRSLILGTRDAKSGWSFRRLPKGSHSYDGAHGWNTEWPRIREIGEEDFLMTMHGTFWRFPRDFGGGKHAGIRPRSNYLKVIGDFARWGDRIAFGCDDTAKSEFLNKRKAKGEIAAPQSQSNLWFVEPAKLDSFGPAIGRGGVWVGDAVEAGVPSDPFLIAGYDRKALHLHLPEGALDGLVIRIDVDANGTGEWKDAQEISLTGKAYQWVDLGGIQGEWVRLTSNRPVPAITAWFHLSNRDPRGMENDAIFAGLGLDSAKESASAGVLRARDQNKRTLAFAAMDQTGKAMGAYELDANTRLVPTADEGLLKHTLDHASVPKNVYVNDPGSILIIDDAGRRWRLPKGDASMDKAGIAGSYRVAREVATERDLLHVHGSFYELPAENAGGFAKLRPVATHNLSIHDFCSYRGLFIISGVTPTSAGDNPHVIRSEDGKAALWAGAIDDIWKMGKARGSGGPWHATTVKAGEVSDPYLMTGYDQKSLSLQSDKAVNIAVEIDLDGTGRWAPYQTFEVNGSMDHTFPEAFQAYWVRFRSDGEATVTTKLEYR
ncbi:MAG: hypothetical protein ACKO2G_07530 [Verrucomicrobiales bacterium]